VSNKQILPNKVKSKIKAKIKSVPFLYNILLSGHKAFCRVRDMFHRNAQKRFTKFCTDLPNFVLEPMFVKVGANDGVTDDPCTDIILTNESWKGLLIEPVPYCFERLRENFHDARRFDLEQVAVGSPAGEATFYYVDPKASSSIPNLPAWFDQLGSFDKNHIVNHLGLIVTPFVVEFQVKVVPLNDILKNNRIQFVHLLHIDTEGHDYEVLKTLNLLDYQPLSIYIEHRHLQDTKKKEMLHYLRNHGYSVFDCGGDYFALHKKSNKRLKKIV
jgi:FkbM family methyltransferase